MSKKVFNVFSILCFALVLCFIGCTELINPKTETDINLNIDLSKIIKSTRNTGETQSSVSLGENPTIKVAIYDAKKYNATTNLTDNLDLITEAQAKIENNKAKVKLNNIPVGIYAIVFAELSFTDENSTEVMYAGNSEVFKVKASDNNKISLVLIKVGVDDEDKPDDSKPEEIINAKEPEIIIQPISCVKTTTESTTGGTTKTTLTCTAKSTDGGNLSFMWYKSDDGTYFYEFNDIKGPSLNGDGAYTSSTNEIEAHEGERLYFYCVVTNTNEKATGEKVASVQSDIVQVACIKGTLSNIKATYKSDSNELWGKDFTYSNVSVTETYTSSDNATEPTIITVNADSNRYTISPTDSEDAIGYVPYTVTRNDSTLTAIITVPVKYELDANNLVLETCFNSIYVSESDTDNAIKIPQYGTVKYVYRISDYDKISIIDENGTNTAIKDINNIDYYTATIVDEKDQDIGSIVSDGDYKYTVTLQSANEWFVCNSNKSKDFSVKVCPWEIILTMDDGSTVDESNLSENTSYRLSINNEAIPSGFNFSPYLESGSSSFPIQDYILTTPAAIEDPQPTQIIAKCGDQKIASITVTVGAMVGSVNNPIIAWDDLKNYLEISSEEPSTIYIQGNLSSNEKAVVNRPVTIVPIGNVTITRTSEFDYIFEVNKKLELQGSETSIITLAGNVDVENTQPLISCVSDVNVNLNYCTLENANCGSNSNGSVLYASNGSVINMDYCVVQNSKGVPILLCNPGENKIVNTSFLNNASCINVNENANLVLDSCTFCNKTNSTYSGELSIYKANTITIKNTTFETVNSGYNIYAYVAPEVVLDGTLSIPSIYFYNSYSDSSLGIVCGEDLTLIEPQIPITITAVSYDENFNGQNVDINLFSLEDGKTVPYGIFTLANADYKINSNTGNIESTNTSSGGGSSVTIYTDYAELKNAIATISTGETETFYVSGNITSTSTTITVKGNITLLATEEGASIYRLSTFTSDSLFTIEKSASLVLGGTSSGQLVIDGSDVDVSYPLINSSGSLEIGENCILQNNNNVTSTKNGGAIYEYCTSGDAPTLKISGGKIQNCNAKAGGAIYIQGGPSCEINFDFSGGEISNNYAKGNGGAVYLKYTSGTLSGTIIKNNYAQITTSPVSTAGGGGIYVTQSTLKMTAGSIENNTTNSYGGGVFVNTSGIFNITGGDIKENATNSETTDSMNIYACGTVTINETTVPTACNQNIINGVLTEQTSSYEFTDFVE